MRRVRGQTQTEDLVQRLVQDAGPVRRLPHPALRAVTWMVLATGSVAVFIAWIGLRGDLSEKLADPRFVIEVAAAFLTSVMAAAAAFCASCPGRPIWERFAPLPFLGVWLVSLGERCWRELSNANTFGVSFAVDSDCFEKIVLLSLVPAILIWAMLRKGAPVAPLVTTGLAALAATALAAAGLRLFHTQDSSLLLIVWQFGTVLALTGATALAGQLILPWRSGRHPLRPS